MSYRWDRRAIETLIVETVELLKEVELGTRRRLDGVQLLYPGLEPKGLQI